MSRFASDCVETLEEINIQGKESFLSKGGKNFDLIPCLNDNSDHIQLFEKLVNRYLYKMNTYLLYKSLHLIAVISWLAGLLYLPRIFVYHSEATHVSQKKYFKVMERKLYSYIMMPAMLFSWIFGILLIHSLGFSIFSELWMQIKGASVLILTHYHFYLGKQLRLFATDANEKSAKFFRIINEIPTITIDSYCICCCF